MGSSGPKCVRLACPKYARHKRASRWGHTQDEGWAGLVAPLHGDVGVGGVHVDGDGAGERDAGGVLVQDGPGLLQRHDPRCGHQAAPGRC